MPGTGDALRRTSDSLLRDLEALLELEEEKRTIDPGDPRLVELASQIEQIAKRVLASSTSQRAQTQLIHALTEAGSPAAPDTPIENTPRSMEAILAAWRQAERQLDAAKPGSIVRFSSSSSRSASRSRSSESDVRRSASPVPGIGVPPLLAGATPQCVARIAPACRSGRRPAPRRCLTAGTRD